MTKKQIEELDIASYVCQLFHKGEAIEDKDLKIAIRVLNPIIHFAFRHNHNERYLVFASDLQNVLTQLESFALARGLKIED